MLLCVVSSSSLVNSAQVTLGPGQGVVAIRARVTGTNTTSSAVSYSYVLPTVTGLDPMSGSTLGDIQLVITGSELGWSLTSGSSSACPARNRVLLGRRDCIISQVWMRLLCFCGARLRGCYCDVSAELWCLFRS